MATSPSALGQALRPQLASQPSYGIGYRPNLAPTQPWNRQNGFVDTGDSQRQWQNERLLARNQGDLWEGEQAQNAGQYGGAEGGYGGLVSDLYNPIWNGGGGYTPEQQQGVLQEGLTEQGLGGLDQNFLTPEEQQAAMGDPMGAYRMSGGYESQLNDISQTTGQRQTEMLPFLQGAQDAWQGRLEGSYNNAIDPNRLRASAGYGQQVGAGLGTAMEGVQDPGLGLTDQYLNEAHISDQEVDQLASAGGRTAAAPYQAGLSALRRQAAASGMTNPVGVAGAELQYNMAEGAAAADAANRARLDARSAQRGAAQNIQDTQLGAAGQRSGLKMNYGNMAIGAAGDLERARMTGEQDLSNRQIGAGEDLAAQGTNNARYLTQSAIDTYGQAGDRNLQTAQGNADMRLGAYGTGEANQASRAFGLAQNRQGVNQGNSQTRLGTANDLSTRYQSAYNPWLSAQAEGRQAAQGQQGYFGGRKQDTDQLRLGGAQLQQQGTQGAAGGYSQQVGIDKQPGKVAQGFNTLSRYIKPIGN